MGLVNSSSVFQRLMQLIMKNLAWSTCLIYVNDSIVMSRTFDEHLDWLKEVFDRFRRAGLKLKPQKCKLFQLKAVFLEHVFSAAGVEVDTSKTACLEKFINRTVCEMYAPCWVF
jgi:hypothetical protein